MSFEPPRCPNPDCPHHVATDAAATPFFWRRGTFPGRQEDPVPRFQCRTCGRHFSEQTFSATYRQKRPDLATRLARLAGAGASIRACARLLGVNRKTATRKLKSLATRGASGG